MTATMIGLVKAERKPGAVLKEVPVPAYGPDEVLVRVKASSICGTDVHIYKWDDWAARTVVTPNVFGHEFAGIVEAVGDRVTNVKAGDHVSGEGHVVCGVCKACRTGNAHVCPHTRSFGITLPGCFGEYAVLRASNVIRNDPKLPFEIACLQDPLGNAVQTVLAGDIVGKSVAVVGVGPIGLMAIAVAKACGSGTIIAVDINPYRLEMAKTMGADVIVNSKEVNSVQAIRAATNGEGAEVVLEMSGHPDAIRDALKAAAQAGRVSLLGIPSKEVSFDLAEDVIFKGLQLAGITGRRMYDTWYQLKGLLERGRIDLTPLITHRLTLDRYEEAFDLMSSGNCGKIVFIHQ
ncbi:L-threonine 3-dehydrogenase [Paenibacillus thiaminolyticus]|uniref:L-threonine 3-dehydrogenase n=1 Tax=Paenibacillus thiaminolyticus TaxID=49283 RepID=A0AAP9DWE2_PANTH|nr:L-threonine 3-dehydrogenase [Paenibacillus thiaminolyticus]MCY9534676.1 L-threonine 3-dehydrogenase [Paenibacillus thiaminolyticus]MCY9603326.1 L-threonine 3-dehydrogenase [Paenibacillus thiaminolyticus]MCY9609998.1 L-threonine 3-dehydrogenase [Paenibacillus thiaminolyticus]MCY9615474.1 L-threonine 3-dehydrogenase [Paenibacillus thiaminolyticus]MCY9617179.1 L-threonine 3-dehydrogenase [Paenibacillus thiaminolyticus]